MTPALTKYPGVGNGHRNSEHGKFFKETIWRGKFFCSTLKKQKKENGRGLKAQYREVLDACKSKLHKGITTQHSKCHQ